MSVSTKVDTYQAHVASSHARRLLVDADLGRRWGWRRRGMSVSTKVDTYQAHVASSHARRLLVDADLGRRRG
ncbi:hypothetical protein QEK82_002304 [Stenotrophomonas maltophilia]|nr:hypothetical protein [Stenotrophomonas maltophilia]